MITIRLPAIFIAALILLGGLGEDAWAAEKIRVACVGASITFGAGINDRKLTYPAQMQRMLGDGYEVRNFGVNSRTMLKHGDFPYWDDKAYRDALAFNPNVVVIDLGGNDSKPQNWKFKDEFAADTRDMIASFRALPAKPRVLLAYPMPAFKTMWGINDETITKELIPLMQQTAVGTDTEIIDLHTAFLGKEKLVFDNIHPNAEGAGVLAKVVAGTVAFKADEAFDLRKAVARKGLTVQTNTFHGYHQLIISIKDGRQLTVVCPYRTAAGRPIAWRGEFFGHEPQTDLALLERGFHVVYVNAENLYGAPAAMKIWDNAYKVLGDLGLKGKITLIGMSRGGLYCYAWAALHPKTVAALYGDAPVCDFKSWPGRTRTGATRNEWAGLLTAYGFKNDEAAFAYKKNPVDNLKPLAKAGIPIIHVIGDADTTVPVADNSDLLEKRYRELGGTIEVIRKPGVDHHPHSLANPEPIVAFILSHQK